MLNAACCDLNSKSDILKLNDLCHNPSSKCWKQSTSIPKQYMLEGSGFEKN